MQWAFLLTLVFTAGCASQPAPREERTSLPPAAAPRPNLPFVESPFIERVAHRDSIAFIAKAHRKVHELWGFGVLSEIEDRRDIDKAWQDLGLGTQLELTVDKAGAILEVRVLRPSGFRPFDLAAIDSAWDAGPFPEPPSHLESTDGKVRLSWALYRDERQCSTSGVEVYRVLNVVAWENSRGAEGRDWDDIAARRKDRRVRSDGSHSDPSDAGTTDGGNERDAR